MSFSFNRDPRRKHFMNFVSKVHNLLLEAYWDEHTKTGLTKSQIAAALGKNKGQITRWLEGQSNMTFESLSDLTFELNRDIEISFPAKQASVNNGRNFFYVGGKELETFDDNAQILDVSPSSYSENVTLGLPRRKSQETELVPVLV